MFWTRDSSSLPPREPGRLFVGNVDIKLEPSYFLELQKKHGDLYTLKIFGQTIIVACGYDTIKEVLDKNGEITSGHPVVFGYTEYFELTGIIGGSGSVWRHRETLENPKNQDFIYSFLNEQKRRKTNNEDMTGFGDRDLLIMSYALYFGSTSIVHVLHWYILFLLHNPDVVERMRKEIQENVGMNKSVTMADQSKLPYCRAVMYEVLRACSTIVVSPTRVFSEDIEVKGFTLPKDARLMPALCTINLDPVIFPEPEKFKPERFLDENGELAGYEKVQASFALGPRDCLAKILAKMEMFIFSTTLVQNYDIENEAGKAMPSLNGISKAFRMPIPYEVCFKKIK